MKSKAKFIELVITKKIKLFNKKKDEIVSILSKHKGLVKLPNEPIMSTIQGSGKQSALVFALPIVNAHTPVAHLFLDKQDRMSVAT